MDKTLAIFDFDYLYGTCVSATPACAASVSHAHKWTIGGNSFKMDCRFFCTRQEAIDIIERRIIPSDADAVFAMLCGEVTLAAIIGMSVFYDQAMISDNSLIAGLSLIVFYTYSKVKYNKTYRNAICQASRFY